MSERSTETAAIEAAARRGYTEATKESPGYPLSRDWDRLPPEWQDHWRRIVAAILGSVTNGE